MGFSGACIDLLRAHSQSLLAAGRHTSAPQLSLVCTERPPVQKQISRSLRSQLQVMLMNKDSVISVRELSRCVWHNSHITSFFICHIHYYTKYNQQWNVFSAFNPYKCTHIWSSGQPTLQRPGSSRGFGALLKGLTSAVDNSCRNRDSNPQPRIISPTLYPLGHGFSPWKDYIVFGSFAVSDLLKG